MAAINLGTVDQGELARISMSFSDPDTGAAIDPSPLLVIVRSITDGTTTTYTFGGTNPQDAYFTKISTGSYLLRADTSAIAGDYEGRAMTPSGNTYQFSWPFAFSVTADTL